MKKRLIPIYSVLIVAIVLLAAFAPSCGNVVVPVYTLTMAVSPAGSGTAQDVTGGSPYASGTVVNITATALGSYTFVKWTSSDGGTFTPANVPTTQFKMPAQNVTTTAHFVGPLDHFKCYNVTGGGYIDKQVRLVDQFVNISATVGQAVLFANPTEKVLDEKQTPIWNPDHHFTFYSISYEGVPGYWTVNITNQFWGNETQTLLVEGPVALAVPTQKVEPQYHEAPLSLDHFLVYKVVSPLFIEQMADLTDEFGTDAAGVGEAVYFANPVQKTVGTTVTPIAHPDEHLVFYRLYFTETTAPGVMISNQFAQQQSLELMGPACLLGVPSQKLWFQEAPL
jgi:uncharacterized repeat protein (TIGR02543 family)